MSGMVSRVMSAAKKYTMVDYGFFKFLMISTGILLGVYFNEAMKSILWLVWLVFIVSAAWMIWQIYRYTR